MKKFIIAFLEKKLNPTKFLLCLGLIACVTPLLVYFSLKFII